MKNKQIKGSFTTTLEVEVEVSYSYYDETPSSDCPGGEEIEHTVLYNGQEITLNKDDNGNMDDMVRDDAMCKIGGLL